MNCNGCLAVAKFLCKNDLKYVDLSAVDCFVSVTKEDLLERDECGRPWVV